jgi:hypothetical protein
MCVSCGIVASFVHLHEAVFPSLRRRIVASILRLLTMGMNVFDIRTFWKYSQHAPLCNVNKLKNSMKCDM